MADPVRRDRWFVWALAAITIAAFALRIAYVLIERRDFEPGGDAFFYHGGANLLADGKGFISPFHYPVVRQAAEHPPLYVLYLAIPSLFGMQGVLAHLLWSCVAGAATVALVGLVGRDVAGPRAGLVAAVLAALYPNIWAPDGMLQAETLAIFCTVLALWLAYRCWFRPSWLRFGALGAACGAAALARSELLLLVPLIVIPLAVITRQRSARERLAYVAAGIGASVLLIAPWIGYNASRFEHPVLMSAQIGPLMTAANCDSTYYGEFQGYFDIRCSMVVDEREGITSKDDQSVVDKVNREAAFEYIGDHLGRLPTVERVRLQRLVGLYHPSYYVHQDALIEGRELWISWAGLYSFWGVAAFAIAGAVVLVRRANSPPLFPLLAPIVAVVVTVLITYASTRFRAVAEPSLVILTAIALDALIARVMRRGAAPAPAEPAPESVAEVASSDA